MENPKPLLYEAVTEADRLSNFLLSRRAVECREDKFWAVADGVSELNPLIKVFTSRDISHED